MKSSEMPLRADTGCIAADLRSESRDSSGRAVTITILPAMEASMPAHLLDISSSGAGLILEWPLNPGASVAVEWDDTVVLAEVVHCSGSDGYYHAGLKTSFIIIDRTKTR